jgi:hypothetical protein
MMIRVANPIRLTADRFREFGCILGGRALIDRNRPI